MKRLLVMFSMCALCFATSCKNDKKQTETMDGPTEMDATEMTQEESPDTVKKVLVALESKSESTAKGNVVFTEENGIVTMTAEVTGLDEGTHAIHIHEKADCSSADGTSTGGHWNPTSQPHGKWGSAEGYHKGDIGNMEANADGLATITRSTDAWCIGCGDPNKDVLGHAIIVHSGTDDYKTQPTGDAGGRISCGGIIQ